MDRFDKIELIKDIMDDLHHGISVVLSEQEYNSLDEFIPSCVSVGIGGNQNEYKLFINN